MRIRKISAMAMLLMLSVLATGCATRRPAAGSNMKFQAIRDAALQVARDIQKQKKELRKQGLTEKEAVAALGGEVQENGVIHYKNAEGKIILIDASKKKKTPEEWRKAVLDTTATVITGVAMPVASQIWIYGPKGYEWLLGD